MKKSDPLYGVLGHGKNAKYYVAWGVLNYLGEFNLRYNGLVAVGVVTNVRILCTFKKS